MGRRCRCHRIAYTVLPYLCVARDSSIRGLLRTCRYCRGSRPHCGEQTRIAGSPQSDGVGIIRSVHHRGIVDGSEWALVSRQRYVLSAFSATDLGGGTPRTAGCHSCDPGTGFRNHRGAEDLPARSQRTHGAAASDARPVSRRTSVGRADQRAGRGRAAIISRRRPDAAPARVDGRSHLWNRFKRSVHVLQPRDAPAAALRFAGRRVGPEYA